MKTVGPFFDLEHQRWISFVIEDEPAQIYILADETRIELEPNQTIWVWHDDKQYFRMTYQDQKITYINLIESQFSQDNTPSYRFMSDRLDKNSEYFTPKEKLTAQEKRFILVEFKSKEEQFKRPVSQPEAPYLTFFSGEQAPTVETVPLSLGHLSLDTINQQITDYPLDETLRAKILDELYGEWPFKDTLTDDFQIKVATRVLGGKQLELADLNEQEDPSETLRYKWMLDGPDCYAGFFGIDATQKQNAIYFVGRLFAQVLRVLNAPENIPERYKQLMPPDAQPNIDLNQVHHDMQPDDVCSDDFQQALWASLQKARFLNLDEKTRGFFKAFITKPSQDGFKDCIYHDAVNNIWQTILYYLRVIGYYLHFGRFYELNLALTELSQQEIQNINQTLFPGESATSFDSLNDLMFRC